ncbi:MAG: phage portal protein, partial [Clostridia bacterium]|nr:phage portal protein [Clostridia bacterium]
FVKSGLANNIDDMSGFYWILKNTGGMDDVDLRRFLERMKVVKAATVEDGTEATPHTIDVPFEARDSLLNRLEADLYKDFQIINVSELSAAAKTATEIRAAYQPMEDKCGAFEYCIRDFIAQLLSLIGVEDEPRFTWNRIANMTEETQMVMTAAMYLDEKTILNKLPWLTPEEVEDVLAQKDERDFERLTGGDPVG